MDYPAGGFFVRDPRCDPRWGRAQGLIILGYVRAEPLYTAYRHIVNTVLRPEFEHEKEYIVHVDKLVVDEFLEQMAQGLVILGRKTKPAITQKQNDHAFRIVLTEGRNRQIRRMCEELDYRVTALKRVRILNIVLGKLPVGAWRPLRKEEQRTLFHLLNYKPSRR